MMSSHAPDRSLLCSVRDKIQRWMTQETCQDHRTDFAAEFDRLLFDSLTELRSSLIIRGLGVLAADIDQAFKAARAELGSAWHTAEMYYIGKRISPKDVAWDAWPDRGAELTERFCRLLSTIDNSFFTEEDRPTGEWCIILAPFNGGVAPDSDTFGKWRRGKNGRSVRTLEVAPRRYRVHLDDLPPEASTKQSRESIILRHRLPVRSH